MLWSHIRAIVTISTVAPGLAFSGSHRYMSWHIVDSTTTRVVLQTGTAVIALRAVAGKHRLDWRVAMATIAFTKWLESVNLILMFVHMATKAVSPDIMNGLFNSIVVVLQSSMAYLAKAGIKVAYFDIRYGRSAVFVGNVTGNVFKSNAVIGNNLSRDHITIGGAVRVMTGSAAARSCVGSR